MRLDLLPILDSASKLAEAIEVKSWHHACNAAHACLCAMPSPAWAETEPGAATYYFSEAQANHLLNQLRQAVMLWLATLVDSSRTWEASDEWPQPKRLTVAIASLRRFVPEEAECIPG